MRARDTDSEEYEDSPPILPFIIREGFLIGLVSICAFLVLALATYSDADPGWSKTGVNGVGIENAGGPVGAWLADVFFSLFG